ncbi:MAG: ATP-binding protein [Candidatus Cloacimonadota bacterium]|nr:ATP-binding protein [Candidatus Cloacimonadota bacterium]
MMFINREKELELLQSEYNRNTSAFVVIYGRRRTGKTTLINQFLKDKRSLYFFADTQNEKGQIRRFQDQLANVFDDKLLQDVTIESWDSIFDYLCEKLDDDNKFILAIDEFQSLVKSNKHFSSIFQRIFDTKLKNKNIMIILCGSLISMMHSETLDYSSPLYGRRTAQIKLQEIEFSYYNEFYKGLSNIELIEHFTVTGGIPKYIELFNQNKNLYKSIKTEILNRNKFLYLEPRFLLREEVNDVSTYFSILSVIAAGNHKLSKITSRLGVQASSITSFLKKLIDLDIVEKQVPVTESNPSKSKKGLYFIKDNFLRFWFYFVFPYQSYLEIDNSGYVEDKIKSELKYLVANVFESLSIQFMFKFNFPFAIEKCGRWWDKNNEIDVVGIGDDNIIFGECKWSKKHVGINILTKLQTKSVNVKWKSKKRNEYFVLFSKSGFSSELIEYEKKNDNVFLIDVNKL